MRPGPRCTSIQALALVVRYQPLRDPLIDMAAVRLVNPLAAQ